MKVPRFWEQHVETEPDGRSIVSIAWGWSEHDPAEARSRAAEASKRIGAFLDGNGQEPPSQYGYDERLPREEIIREFTAADGSTHAFVSRNAYGALVLNARDLLFIDVDFPPERPKSKLPTGIVGAALNLLVRFIGNEQMKRALLQQGATETTATPLEEIRRTANAHPDLGFRIYRTHSGHRVMVCSQPMPAESQRAQTLLAEFKSDPLYVRMCKNQECARARLTPKPWRCGLGKPPGRFPFIAPATEQAAREWEQRYNTATRGFATCELVDSVGPQDWHEEVRELIELHDRLTGVGSGKALA